jgi:non-ribosomal peptide synthetase component F
MPRGATLLFTSDGQDTPASAEAEAGLGTNYPEAITFLRFDPSDGVAVPPAQRASPASLAYVMYTSGTSGRPKGVMVEQRSIIQLVIEAGYIEIRADDRILQTGSLAFDAATFEIWGALLNGASVYVAPRHTFLRADALQTLIRREHITILVLTTALFNQLAGESSDVFEGVRVLLTGGERVSASHMMRVR